MCNNIELWGCNCECHSNSDMHHCMPCCEICPNCNKRIKHSFIDDHKQQCQSVSNYQDPLNSPVARQQPNFD